MNKKRNELSGIPTTKKENVQVNKERTWQRIRWQKREVWKIRQGKIVHVKEQMHNTTINNFLCPSLVFENLQSNVSVPFFSLFSIIYGFIIGIPDSIKGS